MFQNMTIVLVNRLREWGSDEGEARGSKNLKDWLVVICGGSPSSNFKSRSQFVETANDTVRRPSRERKERERRQGKASQL